MLYIFSAEILQFILSSGRKILMVLLLKTSILFTILHYSTSNLLGLGSATLNYMLHVDY